MKQLLLRTIFYLAFIWMTLAWGIGVSFASEEQASEKRFSVDVNRDNKGFHPAALTLDRAISLSLSKNLELGIAHFEVLALKGAAIQSGMISNPGFGLEIEHFGGSGSLQGVDASESTARIGQLIEIGNKRFKRTRVALLETDAAKAAYESKRRDVIAQVEKDFVDVLSSQERVILAKEMLSFTHEILDAASQRVKAGKVSPLEEVKAKVTYSKALIDLRRAEAELYTLRKRLASNWGVLSPDFKKVKGNLESVKNIPTLKKLKLLIRENPELMRESIEIERRKAVLNLELSKRWPDLTLEGGVRHYEEMDEYAFLAGVSFPLPFLNRNQGSIDEAQQKLFKARKERHAVKLQILVALAKAYSELRTALSEIKILRLDILPEAHQAFEAAREGYKQGKLSYLDVLDAQKTLFETKGQYLEVMASYHKTIADLERLVGQRFYICYGKKKRSSEHEA